MKNLKSVLAVLAALCLLLCLTVPVFATEAEVLTTGTVTEATAGAQDGAQVEDGDIVISLDDETAPVEEEGTEEEHNHDHEEETQPESTGHKVLRIVLTVLEVITSIALIIIVLMQSGKESGLSGALSGNSDSYMSKDNRATMDKKLASLTKWVALAWVVLTLVLSLI
jgi:preprotein translocase subunit SecG